MNDLAKFMFDLGADTMRTTRDEITQQQLAEANEEVDHRMPPEALEDYAESYQRTLEAAQRLNPTKPFVEGPTTEF